MPDILYNAFLDLRLPATCFAMLSVFLYRKNLITLFRTIKYKHYYFNLSCYFLDSLFIVPIAGTAFAFIYFNIPTLISLHIIPQNSYNTLPAYVVVALAIFLGDIIGYCRHRAEHTKILWPIHLMHHSDTHLSWLSVFRIHPLNRLSTTIIDNLLLAVLGLPIWALMINGLVRHYYGMLIHANLPWTYGWLGKIFVSPAMHRWHHVLEGQGMHSNYATIFSFLDQAFGTYYVPSPCNVALGVKGHHGISIMSYAKQFIHPFTEWIKALISLSKKNLFNT